MSPCPIAALVVAGLLASSPARAQEQKASEPERSAVLGMYVLQSHRNDDQMLGGGIEGGGRWRWLVWVGRESLVQMASVPRSATVFESRSRVSFELELSAQLAVAQRLKLFAGAGAVYKGDAVITRTAALDGSIDTRHSYVGEVQGLLRLGIVARWLEGGVAFYLIGQPEVLVHFGLVFGR